MSNFSKVLLSVLLFHLMGAFWGWWPLGGFMSGLVCFAIMTTWLIEAIIGSNEPKPRSRRS